MKDSIKRSRFDLPTLAGLSGLKLGYLKHLSRGAVSAGPEAVKGLARAYRAKAKQLSDEADALDPQPASDGTNPD